jgi:membrane associated rhomboid family serine protease
MGGGGLFPSGIKALLIANTAVFVLQYGGLDNLFMQWFALWPSRVVSLLPRVWQLGTYLFLHAGFTHILFNMLILWMFGRDLEGAWGRDRFLRFFFFCGVGAGVCIVAVHYLFGDPNVPTIGASGAVYGVLLASAILWPDRIVYMNFLFPIKMKYLVMIYGGIAFLGSMSANSGVSHIGHLGGMIFAFVFLKTPMVRGFDPFASLREQYRAWRIARAKRKFRVYLRKHGSGGDPWVH